MLRVKVFVNLKEIDEIQILRIDGHGKDEPIGIYCIHNPKGYNHLIHHEKAKGYRALLLDALTILEGTWKGSEKHDRTTGIVQGSPDEGGTQGL